MVIVLVEYPHANDCRKEDENTDEDTDEDTDNSAATYRQSRGWSGVLLEMDNAKSTRQDLFAV